MGSVEKRTIDLTTLACEINAEHRACEEAVGVALRHAINAGEMLTQAKENVPHGGWGMWLAENFEGSERTAQAYMKVYRRRDEIRNGAADLSLRGALKELSEPTPIDRVPVALQRERLIHEMIDATLRLPEGRRYGAVLPDEVLSLHRRIDEIEEQVTLAQIAGYSPREWGAFKNTIPPHKMNVPIAQLRREGYSRPTYGHCGEIVSGTVRSAPYFQWELEEYQKTEVRRRAWQAYVNALPEGEPITWEEAYGGPEDEELEERNGDNR